MSAANDPQYWSSFALAAIGIDAFDLPGVGTKDLSSAMPAKNVAEVVEFAALMSGVLPAVGMLADDRFIHTAQVSHPGIAPVVPASWEKGHQKNTSANATISSRIASVSNKRALSSDTREVMQPACRFS